MRFEGIVRVLERIGFLQRVEATIGAATIDPATWRDETWKYTSEYARGPGTEWLTDQFGAIVAGGPHGRLHMAGYDACVFIRRWLQDHGYADRSLAEVVLTNPEWTDLKEHVGPASLFWSHLQSEPLVGVRSTLGTMAAYLRSSADSPFIWCDYVCLRQARQGDFRIPAVIECVHLAGAVVACIDVEMEYAARSFCLVESFAAVVGGCRYQCVSYATREVLASRPVNSRTASTRWQEEKIVIDTLIAETIGFERLDAVIGAAIREGEIDDELSETSEDSETSFEQFQMHL